MKPDKRDWAVLALTLLVCLPFIAGCGDKGSANIKQPDPEREVAVAPARKGNLAEILSLTGTLLASQEVKITSKIPGRVDKVLVEEGTPVKAGDVLIKLEQRELLLAVKQAEAAVATEP